MGVSICQPLACPCLVHVGLWRHLGVHWCLLSHVGLWRHHAAFHLSAMSTAVVSLPTSDLSVPGLASVVSLGDLCAFMYGERSCNPRLPIMGWTCKHNSLRLAGMLGEMHHTCMNDSWSTCVWVAMILLCAYIFACWIFHCFGLSRLPRPVLPAGGGTVFGDGSTPGGGPCRFASAGSR